ncbi:bifunctional diguanylate cyclase/phosphodiesterase [Shewanella sp. Actino-trap-3]|uniref:bifunctional diguanylate cyclase/phosphodiesterase n=1 Tax=Shewanella sp. Actino-trap-3 TaxID=2058331 RepID=UPI000C31FA6B|nr:GGDEF domain-containing protein [Shewanella sp. Actino-trap-3]PKG77767.1 bifunctional diguanylate cyclase/phosphodiesterase [Shewanella sp. Actino-trap-3]|tara:strand:+ start:12719 stop:14962 length:2244 start_codon:yes stop_codon:yes gene_type:complete
MDIGSDINHFMEESNQHSFRESSVERYSTILDMVLQGLPLGEILHDLVLLIEAQKIGTRASVLLLSDDGKRLLSGAAPNLPEEYNNAINGIEIGPNIGSCGAAAFTCESVIVEDIEHHPNWQDYKVLPLKAGLKACWSEPIKDSNQKVLGTFAMYYDTVKSPSEQDLYLIQEAARLASLAIDRSRGMYIERLSSQIFNSLPIALVITTEDNSVLSVNPIFKSLTSTYYSNLKLFDVHRFLSHSPHHVVADLFENLNRGQAWQGELKGLKSDNDIIDIALTVTVIRDSFTQQNCFAWLITDISARKNAEKLIDFQTNYDQLTGLSNRKYLFNTLQTMIDSNNNVNGCKQEFNLMLMDIDHFKQINDTIGHDNGDLVLKFVAQRLLSVIPENVLIARIAADEFALVLPGKMSTESLISLFNNLTDELKKHFIVGSQDMMLSMSTGLARFPYDADNVEQILNCATQAMYNAKAQGRNCLQFFNQQIQKDAERNAELHLYLKSALSQDEFELYYQPIVNPFSGQIIKAEVLLRWVHNGQFISPDEFIPIAEESGLIVQIGEWVRMQALTTIVALQKRHLAIPLSINVSTIEFWTPDLQHRFLAYFDVIQQKLGLDYLPYSLITLEITESLMMKQQETINQLLTELRHRGMQISVDDFGTGYSSLSYLANFPVDQIKIDKSFIHKISSGSRHKALIEAIVSMSRALDLAIVVEGVETQVELDYIKQQDIEAVQGYYFYKPMPQEAFFDLLAK